MTAQPDPNVFVTQPHSDLMQLGPNRPNVAEQYWGYEIRPGELVVDLAVLVRLAVVFFGFACAIAALGIWAAPLGAFGAGVLLQKVFISVVLGGVAFALITKTPIAGRVLLQVDTQAGELREVVYSLTGRVIELASYGFDSIEAIETLEGGERAQIALRVRNAGLVPAGDGHAVLLVALKERLRSDLGLGGGIVRAAEYRHWNVAG